MDPFEVLLSGDILGAVTQVYTNVLGDWFLAIGLFILLGMVYLKTEDATAPMLLSFILATIMGLTLITPEVRMLMYIIAALSMTGLFYKIFRG